MRREGGARNSDLRVARHGKASAGGRLGKRIDRGLNGGGVCIPCDGGGSLPVKGDRVGSARGGPAKDRGVPNQKVDRGKSGGSVDRVAAIVFHRVCRGWRECARSARARVLPSRFNLDLLLAPTFKPRHGC